MLRNALTSQENINWSPINLAKLRQVHSARAAMLFANRLLAAQLSSAWKQRSYPALWETTLRAFLRFCQDGGKLTSRNTAGPGNLDSSSSAIHRRAEDCPPYRRAMLCSVGRFAP